MALILLTACALNGCGGTKPLEEARSESSTTLRVEIDPDVEFMGFIYHLGWLGPQAIVSADTIQTEYGAVHETAFRAAGIRVYEQHRVHAASPTLAAIMEQASSVDLSAALALFRTANPSAEAGPKASALATVSQVLFPNSPLREALERTTELAGLLDGFYDEVAFDDILAEREAYYRVALDQVRAGAPAAELIDAMEHFYQQDYQAYVLMPSPLLPAGMAFGPRDVGVEGTELYNVFGPLAAQQVGGERLDAGFDSPTRLFELSVHEFGHSFVDHVVSALPEPLLTATEPLYGAIEADMRAQGYQSWEVALQEHFVRAGEVVLAQQTGRSARSTSLEEEYESERGFAYLPIVLAHLERYADGEYETYPDAVAAAARSLADLAVHDR